MGGKAAEGELRSGGDPEHPDPGRGGRDLLGNRSLTSEQLGLFFRITLP